MVAAEFETIRFERDGGVGRLILDRPASLNSMTLQMWRDLRALGRSLLDDPGDLRALVVVGEGRAFSSGLDTSVFVGGADGGESDGAGGISRLAAGEPVPPDPDPAVAGILVAQEAFTWLEEAPFATIAAIRGYALGGGLQLALACDIRIVAHGARLGLLEFRWGIIPDLGGTQRLPRLVGAGKAKEMIFTAAQIDAAEAYRIGLVEQLVTDEELEDAAGLLAAQIAAQPPLALRAAKRAIGAAGTGITVREGLLLEARAQKACLDSADLREAFAAFVEKRPPRYQGR
jgi:enoyl-CoA hydratase/carnithine racemase